MKGALKVVAAAVATALAACAGVLLIAPPGSSVTAIANPTFVAANGGTSLVTAFVLEPAGTPVSDGINVLFTTDLGSIDPQAKTKNGFARANFVSDSRSGTAHITVIAGGAPAPLPSASASPGQGGGGGSTSGSGSTQVQITVGNVRVKQIHAAADPPRITGSSSTHVFATVLDDSGNPILNVPVYFTVVADPATEFFDNQGPVFTDTNGVAENVLRTRRETAGNAQVKASAPGAGAFVDSNTVTIPIL